MSRVQLALTVDDLEASVAFYSRLFSAEPAKRRPGYANFALTDPPLKLVLIEAPGAGGRTDHLGVEVDSTGEVRAAAERLRGEGMATLDQEGVTCCYATQDKTWVQAPDGERWEVYTVLDEDPAVPTAARAGCC